MKFFSEKRSCVYDFSGIAQFSFNRQRITATNGLSLTIVPTEPTDLIDSASSGGA